MTKLLDQVAQGFETLGAAILVLGVIWSVILAVAAGRRSGSLTRAYRAVREALGGTLLLGLEVLVAADLVRTIAVAPTVDNVLLLGGIVIIRTFLSFSLETEIEGVAPWRRATAMARGELGDDTLRSAGRRGLQAPGLGTDQGVPRARPARPGCDP
jgi:uncharacterized membrane protein